MALRLTDVVSDLNAELEPRYLNRLLATALNQKDTLERLLLEEWIFPAPTADASNIYCRLLRRMITARSLALDVLRDGTDTIIFHDVKRILHENRNWSWQQKHAHRASIT